MDLQQLEKSVYGDVENDADLLAELYALEAEEKKKNPTDFISQNSKKSHFSAAKGASGIMYMLFSLIFSTCLSYFDTF